jgi:hypothetical protein
VNAFSVSQVLALYTWFPLVALVFIYLLIARFYQRFSGVRTYFWLYTIPMICYGASAVRYASLPSLDGDRLGDTFFLAGSLLLFGLTGWLFHYMMNTDSG